MKYSCTIFGMLTTMSQTTSRSRREHVLREELQARGVEEEERLEHGREEEEELPDSRRLEQITPIRRKT